MLAGDRAPSLAGRTRRGHRSRRAAPQRGAGSSIRILGRICLSASPALSLPSILVIRSVVGNTKTAVFVALTIVMATIAGLGFGAMYPENPVVRDSQPTEIVSVDGVMPAEVAPLEQTTEASGGL